MLQGPKYAQRCSETLSLEKRILFAPARRVEMLKGDLGECGLGKNNRVDDMALLKEAETRPFYKEIETENTINCPRGDMAEKGMQNPYFPNGSSEYNLVLIFQWLYYTPQTGKT